MPNVMDVNKRFMSVRISRVLFYKLTQDAFDRGMPRSDWTIQLLSEAERRTVLRKEYADKVKAEIREEQRKRKRRIPDEE